MRVKEALALVRRWVGTEGVRIPGFAGAMVCGSAAELSGEAELPPSSDVDVTVLLAGEATPPKLGKFRYEGVLMEVTFRGWGEYPSVDAVREHYQLAHGFRTDTVLADPTGRLGALQRQVAESFARGDWVARRLGAVERKIRGGLAGLRADAPREDLFMGWLFSTGVCCHLFLVADLRNPTVRLRYPAARAVLQKYGRMDVYARLIEDLGCAHWTRELALRHVAALEPLYDAAAGVRGTPFFFRSDIAPDARVIAVDGSRALIEAGDPQGAVFWLGATFARCVKIIRADAPGLLGRFAPAFAAFQEDLGLREARDIIARAGRTLEALPGLCAEALEIVRQNPEVRL